MTGLHATSVGRPDRHSSHQPHLELILSIQPQLSSPLQSINKLVQHVLEIPFRYLLDTFYFILEPAFNYLTWNLPEDSCADGTMDLAYDNIAKETLPKDAEEESSSSQKKPEPQATLNEDIQEAYRAFSNSPWGTWLGGQVGKVVKQVGEQRTSRRRLSLPR